MIVRPRFVAVPDRLSAAICTGLAMLALSGAATAQTSVNGDDDAQVTLLDRIEVTATPIPGSLVDADTLPYTVQSASADDIARAQAGNLTDFMVKRLNGVNSNEVQGSPFQTDITFHGFRASALPGASQGISVYLDGVRINEPFGDIVSWDMVPESAIRSLSLIPGSNPLYGANTLGGALVFGTKSGDTDPGLQGEVSLGSNSRKRIDASYGASADNGMHALVATTLFDEDGWRDASEGRLGTVFAKVGRNGESNSWDVSLLHGRSRLVGNGLLPSFRYVEGEAQPGLYEADRESVYTSPDLTRNRNTLVTGQFEHVFSDTTRLNALAYARTGARSTINGDINGDYEEYVEECADGFGTDGEPLNDDCDYDADEVPGISSGAFNSTQMRQRAQGLGVNLSHQAGAHALNAGVTYDRNKVEYAQFEQDGTVLPDRSIAPNDGAEREFFSGVDGRTRTLGVFVSDLWEITPDTHVTASARWNRATVSNVLTTADDGEKPRETFTYNRVNPALGITHTFAGGVTIFGNVSENSRAPTAIELGCADPEEPCRLPTGLQADPFLEQIVSRTYEAGLRWNPTARQSLTASFYRADNRDDILFLRAPNSQQGYFDNFDRTRYQGVDLQFTQVGDAISWFAGYSFLDATYQAEGQLLSGERILDITSGTRIAGLPRSTFKAGIDWQATPQFSIGADMQATSKRIASGNEDGLIDNLDEDDAGDADELAEITRDISTAGYALFNLHATYRVDDRLELYARVSNVFDRRYESYAAIAEDLFPGGELARPEVAPVEEGPSRFVAPGAPRQYQVGVRFKF